MDEYPDAVLLVKGWTDGKGSEESNVRLSQLRADTSRRAESEVLCYR